MVSNTSILAVVASFAETFSFSRCKDFLDFFLFFCGLESLVKQKLHPPKSSRSGPDPKESMVSKFGSRTLPHFQVPFI